MTAPWEDGRCLWGEDEEAEAYSAEIAGRTVRRTGFVLRPVRRNEVMADDPRKYILEIRQSLGGKSSMAHLNAMTEADLYALHRVTLLLTHGEELPIEDTP